VDPVLADEIHSERDLVLGHDLLAGHVQLQLPHVRLEDRHGGRPLPKEIIPRLEQPLQFLLKNRSPFSCDSTVKAYRNLWISGLKNSALANDASISGFERSMGTNVCGLGPFQNAYLRAAGVPCKGRRRTGPRSRGP